MEKKGLTVLPISPKIKYLGLYKVWGPECVPRSPQHYAGFGNNNTHRIYLIFCTYEYIFSWSAIHLIACKKTYLKCIKLQF